jgi:prepilin-type processing-associated H-X9-DG protein
LWLSFISKYLTKTKMSVESVTGQGAGFAHNWGCPAFQNYVYDTSGGYEHDQLGYGINYTPTYSQTNPPLGTDYPSDYGAPKYRHSLVETDGTKRWQSTVSGSWFKLSNYTRPAERAMFGDAEFWILEALAPPANGEIPPQKIHNREKTYSDGIAGQTMFDFYRHGKFPPVQVLGDSGYYRAQGGKVAYNVLYCDGHVVTSMDRSDAYRSIRMRFPQYSGVGKFDTTVG